MATQIPIRNIYYLLCYAWDALAQKDIVEVAGDDSTELADLFATVLIGGTKHLLRRGLEQGYLEIEEDFAGIRGRLDFARSVRRLLLDHGRAHCIFDELSIDTLPNRILKATMRTLICIPTLHADLRDQLRQLDAQFGMVRDIELNRLAFRRVQLHGNNRSYKFLLNICELVADSLLVNERTGQFRFPDFIRDRKMAKLFEGFVLNLLRIEGRSLNWAVSREKISWRGLDSRKAENTYLPKMETDVSIRTGSTTLILDTKYYGELFASRYESEKFHAAHIYQIFAYVKNLEATEPPGSSVRGMLLYPRVHEDVCEHFQLHGHDMWVCTIDLSQDWREIKSGLISMVSRAIDRRAT